MEAGEREGRERRWLETAAILLPTDSKSLSDIFAMRGEERRRFFSSFRVNELLLPYLEKDLGMSLDY